MVENLKNSPSKRPKPLAHRRKESFKKATAKKGVPTITTRRKLDPLFNWELLKNFDSWESRLWMVRPQKIKSLALKKACTNT